MPSRLYLAVDEPDNGNAFIAVPGTDENMTSGASAQAVSPYIDNVYPENSSYTFDITYFVNLKLAKGLSSKSKLLLSPTQSSNDAAIQRLIVNNQQSSSPSPMQLKLYVLGL
ncbi:MAG: hypothetical protein QM727_15795 [Niabella sp.]